MRTSDLRLSVLVLFLVNYSVDGFLNGKPRSIVGNALFVLRLGGQAELPGSELFPGKGPYIPSGLSQEQYEKLKKTEADQLKRMNLAAWGPRFKRSDVPDGDWMVMSGLWTNGFNAQPKRGAEGTKGGSSMETDNLLSLVANFFRMGLPGFLLSYIMLDSLTTAIGMYRATEMTARQAMVSILRLPLFKTKDFYTSSEFFSSQVLKVVGATLCTPSADRFLEWTNRQRLWSKRRTVTAAFGASLGCLSLWAFLLRVCAKVLG